MYGDARHGRTLGRAGTLLAIVGVLMWLGGAAWGISPRNYAVLSWLQATSNKGAYTRINSTTSHADDCGDGFHGFVAETLWEGSNGDYNGFYWTEVGVSNCWADVAGLYHYWADNRPGLGYFEHKIGVASSNTLYPYKVVSRATTSGTST